MKKFTWAMLVVVAGLGLGWGVVQLMPQPSGSVELSEAPTGGDFTLQSPDGPFSLQEQRGKVVLMYFGYTFCPDICPTNLALMSQALNAMSEQELQRVQGVFVSVDPERDTLPRLAAYAEYFHPNIAGVTGSPAEVAEVASQYGAAYRRVEGESSGGYLVDHSSNTYVIAPDGTLHSALPHASPPQDLLDVTRSLLTRTPTSN